MSDKGVDRRQFLGGAALAAGISGLAQRIALAQAAAPVTGPPSAAARTTAPMAQVAGKVAFITGASSGIGLGQARVFHAAGMKVAIGYIRDDQKIEAEKHFSSGIDRVHFIKADVTDRSALAAAAEEVERVFGKIHLVSANAGVGMPASVANASYSDYDWCLAVNLTGAFNTIHEFLPRIRKHAEGGHLIATSSMSGVLPVANGSTGVYTITKFGVAAMMEGLRAELDSRREPIGASVFMPGYVNTNIGEVDRNRTGAFARAPASQNRAAATAQPANAQGPGMDPMEAGARVLAGIRSNDLFIFSHSEFGPGIQERNEAIMASVPTDAAPAERVRLSAATRENPLYPRERDHMLAKRKG
jgi:NAD(P)-dependent dehydrogenase (short-subunit alcohol dehydrogenase family)